MAVLIVSRKTDLHVDFLIPHLEERKQVVYRLNTEDFAGNECRSEFLLGNSNCNYSLELPGNRSIINVADEIHAVWYRRPSQFECFGHYSSEVEKLCINETDQLINGLYLAMRKSLWVNSPWALNTARRKLHQLDLSQKLGFNVPRTLVTQDPKHALKFIKGCSTKVVVKSLSNTLIPSAVENRYDGFYTNLLNGNELQHIEEIRHCPTFFQEYIEKKFELRVTVIGQKVFACALYSQDSDLGKIDWRNALGKGLRHEATTLPVEVEEKCILLLEALGLNFGAIDLICTPDDEYYFLEINPNGQWGWIEDETEMPLREEFANLLSE